MPLPDIQSQGADKEFMAKEGSVPACPLAGEYQVSAESLGIHRREYHQYAGEHFPGQALAVQRDREGGMGCERLASIILDELFGVAVVCGNE